MFDCYMEIRCDFGTTVKLNIGKIIIKYLKNNTYC